MCHPSLRKCMFSPRQVIPHFQVPSRISDKGHHSGGIRKVTQIFCGLAIHRSTPEQWPQKCFPQKKGPSQEPVCLPHKVNPPPSEQSFFLCMVGGVKTEPWNGKWGSSLSYLVDIRFLLAKQVQIGSWLLREPSPLYADQIYSLFLVFLK